ncbi:hypothetical protein EVG20_g8531 [Dentipellis fragilis]|uniref:Uncharacterized protein n=1 Tax=Dentipellis fragilis TaxID=205917 RepID=A0A4Y9Y4U7_9AGAM|nr:hypothetical protein EVG20_g8531 [Dentipellis fragilis]
MPHPMKSTPVRILRRRSDTQGMDVGRSRMEAWNKQPDNDDKHIDAAYRAFLHALTVPNSQSCPAADSNIQPPARAEEG